MSAKLFLRAEWRLVYFRPLGGNVPFDHAVPLLLFTYSIMALRCKAKGLPLRSAESTRVDRKIQKPSKSNKYRPDPINQSSAEIDKKV